MYRSIAREPHSHPLAVKSHVQAPNSANLVLIGKLFLCGAAQFRTSPTVIVRCFFQSRDRDLDVIR